MEESRQNVFFLVQAAQSLEELFLGFAMHHKVGTGDQQLRRHLDRLGIGDHTVGGFVQAQQHVHRNRLGDQRIAVIGRHPFRVMTEELGLDVAVDEEIAAKFAHQRQARAGERHIQLYLERRRCQHQRANARRIIVDPGGRNYRADALRHHGDVLLVDLMRRADVVAEGLHVPRAGGETRTVTAFSGRLAMAAGVPGKEVETGQVQLIHQMRNAPGVLVPPVKQQHSLAGFARVRGHGWPVPIKQFHAIMGGECPVLSFAHCKFLYAEGAFSFTWSRP